MNGYPTFTSRRPLSIYDAAGAVGGAWALGELRSIGEILATRGRSLVSTSKLACVRPGLEQKAVTYADDHSP